MEQTLLNIEQVSTYLNVKKSFLYSLVESATIPHFRLNRLIRFKRVDLDRWMEDRRQGPCDANKSARSILKATNRGSLDINRVVKKSIEEVKEKCYPSDHGKPDRIRGLRREVEDEGFVS